MKLLACVVVLLALALPALPSAAQAPQILSYQGVLTDNAGNLVPDGTYSVTFRLFDVSSAGAALYTETQPSLSVVRGGFSAQIGTVMPLTLPFDKPYWLELQVAPDATALAPRVPLTSSPYALSLRLPFVGTGSSAGPTLSVTNTGAGADIHAANRLDVGSSTGSGQLNVYLSGSATPVARIEEFSSIGGSLRLSDEAGNSLVRVEPDANGTGGFLSVYRNAVATGFVVNGNDGTEEPVVTIQGAARSAVFDMSNVGNASVALPTDAINAAETFDEPGVASALNGGTVGMDGTVQTLTSRTLTIPAAGYVLVIGTCQAQVGHVNGTASSANFGVSDAAGSLPSNQDVASTLAAALPSGTYTFPTTVHGLFTATAGSHTYYLIGQETGGNYTALDLQLTLVYLPTAYGTVQGTEPQGISTGAEDMQAPVQPALGSAGIAAEQREAEAFHLARLEREMKAMREAFEALKVEQDRQAAAQASRSGK